MKPFLRAVGLCLALSGALSAGEVAFTAKPTATKDGGKVKIAFAVSAPTDVEVAVLDAAGKTVRHLAAGVLGPNAPEPFKKDVLVQEIVWDGKDDNGNPAAGGPFKIRVRTGMSAAYAGTAFGAEPRPDDLANVMGLGMGPGGRVYVLSQRWARVWWAHTALHVYRRTGEYERTIKPFPNALPPEKVAAITRLRDEAGRPLPTIHRILAMEYYPTQDIPQQMAVTPDGNAHLLVLRAAYYGDQGGERYLASVGPDGGIPYDTFAGPKFAGAAAPGDPYLAAASDGKSVYLTGIDRGAADASRNSPNGPALCRVELPGRTDAKPFFGEAGKPGNDQTHLADPRGVAVDGKGRVLVADRGNNRVVILNEKGGTWAGSFEVKSPTWLGVHRGNGSVYVATADGVVKFTLDADGRAAEKGRLALPALTDREKGQNRWCFALDDGADPTILWVGHNRGGSDTLMRCTEKDGAFGPLEKAGFRPSAAYWNVATGFDGKTAACKVGNRILRVLDEDTAKTRDVAVQDNRGRDLSGQTYRLGPDNQIYGFDHGGRHLSRYAADGKWLPYPATKDHADGAIRGRLPVEAGGTTAWERDFDVDRAGNVYAKQAGKIYHGRMRVDKYDKDGNLLGTVIWAVSDGAMGPRVDAAGNIYVADSVKPPGQPYPEFFSGKLVDAKIDARANPAQQYTWMYGSVIKFGPAGGAIWFPILDKNYAYAFEGEAKLPADQTKVKIATIQNGMPDWEKPGELQGALWYRPGVSYLLDMVPSHNRRCHCTASEFDVDDYGRVFHTDQGRFRVVVLDTAGNEIAAFGGYGNQDACGPDGYVMDPAGKFLRPRAKSDPADLKSPFAAPEIAFNWFTGLGVTDRFVYVADGGNLRVVRAALKYAAEETCPIR
jgi:hypothetical protein